MIKKIILFVIILININSCSTFRETLNMSVSTLNGKTYQLINMFADTGITISFYEKEFYGYSGFNTYFGEYEIRRGNNVLFKNISVTKMSEDAQIEEIEKEYIDYITKAYSIEFTIEGIKIKTLDDGELIFKRLR
ncbi:META domain-containing protein [Brachyspira sp.]|uniref:META domain-containing protein n=1 Tax=Brachyspira sp. TaxID=1977261 RepID=UPI003D7EE77F